MLTHLYKMAPFGVVDILIPFPFLPQPLTPKINVEFWILKSFFVLQTTLTRGWGDLRRLERMLLLFHLQYTHFGGWLAASWICLR